MKKAVPGRIAVLAAAALGLLLVAPTAAQAKRTPEKVFRGQIVTSKKRISTSAKSPAAYISKLKKAKSKKFVENKDKESWKIYYAAFFSRPLNDLEVTVKLFDITDGRAKLVSSFEQYVSERGQQSLISNITLERKFFGVNRQIQMVFESKGRRLAIGKFHILGEEEKFSGEVDFTD